MESKKYFVTCDNKTIAENCDMETSLMIVKACFDTYFSEHDMVIAVSEMPRAKKG